MTYHMSNGAKPYTEIEVYRSGVGGVPTLAIDSPDVADQMVFSGDAFRIIQRLVNEMVRTKADAVSQRDYDTVYMLSKVSLANDAATLLEVVSGKEVEKVKLPWRETLAAIMNGLE